MTEHQSNTTEVVRLAGMQPSTSEHRNETPLTPSIPLEWLAANVVESDSGVAHNRLLNAMTASRSSLAHSSVLRMQRCYGNRFVQRMLARQAEGEAEITPEVEWAIAQARGGGQGLDNRTKLQMESAFGADFSGVRIHTRADSHSLNRAVNAIAFNNGQDIFFRDGAYDPGSTSGKELLAHELTHVVQQRGATQISGQAQRVAVQRMCPACEGERKKLQGKLVVGDADDQYEQEADRIAKVVVSTTDIDSGVAGQSSSALRSSPLQLQYTLNGRASIGTHVDSTEQRKFNIFEFSNLEHAIHRQDDSSDGQDSSQQGDTSLGQSTTPDSTNMLDAGQDPRSPSCSPTQSLPISSTTGSFPRGNVYSPSFAGTPGTTVTVNATGSYDTSDPNCSPMAPGSEDYRVTLFQCRSILSDVEVGTAVGSIGSPLTFSATLPTTGIFANAVYYLQFRNGSSHCNIIVGYSVR